MNSAWFGDSYDIVKRFFVGALTDLGYQVYVDPMPTGDWNSSENALLEFLGARHVREVTPGRTALLLDPDTGIRERSSSRHATFRKIVEQLDLHNIVFVFDQSFSRGSPVLPQLEAKLRHLAVLGATASTTTLMPTFCSLHALPAASPLHGRPSSGPACQPSGFCRWSHAAQGAAADGRMLGRIGSW